MEPSISYYRSFENSRPYPPIARFSAQRLAAMQSRGEYITDFEKSVVALYAIEQRTKKKK